VTVAPGGFPKWPLLFLAAVPLFFIGHDDDCEDCDRVNPTPSPTPNPSPSINPLIPPAVPEPSSLLLLGTGLAAFGAGLRRRYQKAKLSAQVESTEEG
jgi:hypothetical protein